MSEPGPSDQPTDRERAPKVRWQSSARWTLVAVVGVVVLGGLGFYLLFLRGDATPPPPARPVVSTTVVPVVPSTVAGSAG